MGPCSAATDGVEYSKTFAWAHAPCMALAGRRAAEESLQRSSYQPKVSAKLKLVPL
jgi:hypothetical protein